MRIDRWLPQQMRRNLSATLALAACAAFAGMPATAQQAATGQGNSKLDATRNELQKIDVKQGTGAEARAG